MKKALIIGINDYQHFTKLDNCENDATDIHNFLTTIGFESTLILNVNKPEFIDCIYEFKDSLTPNSKSLIYFSGHGLQDDNYNYLVAKDSEIKRLEDIRYNCVYVDELMINNIKEGMHIVILDACRNNPFKDGRKSIHVGLSRMAAPQGTIIAFSTSPNSASIEIASDRNGVYTKHLLDSMQQPNTPIELVFKKTRNKVKLETNDRQIPWEESSLSGENFSFIEQEQVDVSPLKSSIIESFEIGLKSLNLNNLISLLQTNNLEGGSIEEHQFYLTLAKICIDFENKLIQGRTLDPDHLSEITNNKHYPNFIEHLSITPESESESPDNLLDNVKIVGEINFGYNDFEKDVEDSFPQFFINEIEYQGRRAILSCFLYVDEVSNKFILKSMIFYQQNPLEYLAFKELKGKRVKSFLNKYFKLRKPFEIERDSTPLFDFITFDDESSSSNEKKKEPRKPDVQSRKKSKVLKRRIHQRISANREFKNRKRKKNATN